ncbi:hypothetical protein PHMEG_00037611, partial [Phytophthora megakarya]
MLFAVNFGSRRLEHFLSPEQHGSGRSVGHMVVGRYEPAISDLRSALRTIEGAAVEWYPRPVPEVFLAVYSHSTSLMLDNAPHDLLVATLNLYTQEFTSIFHAIRDDQHASRLINIAESTMVRGSPDYNRLVRDVKDEGLI